MRKRITLISTDAGPGHNCGLVIGLKRYGQVTTVYENRNLHGLDYLVPDAFYRFGNFPTRGDDLIVVSCGAFDRLINSKYRRRFISAVMGHRKTHVIVTDGRFARNPDYYNQQFKGYDVITTACKRHFREPLPVKTYYQPFDLSMFNQTKNENLTVAHSPFVQKKFREKGTITIRNEARGFGVNFDLISGVGWRECLARKAKAHIFIDQIDHYDRSKFKFHDPEYVWPALGKSGIEALHLGCLVITYGQHYDTEIPAPPVVWVRGIDDFREKFDYYIRNASERSRIANAGREWALKYASYDFAAKNVLR